ncbi:porin [Thalassotalea sp. PLHSN55]|uniref:porin n=1 Tax=Thalassotalea sp. PLHSN55 TaxID=3435888 RepID=UPI003F83EF44
MKQYSITALLALGLIAPISQAQDEPNLDVHGQVIGHANQTDTQDFQAEIHSARIGVIGNHKISDTKISFQLEGEYGEDMTVESTPGEYPNYEFNLYDANVLVFNDNYGGIFIGSGTSGTYKDVYAKVDIFDINNMRETSNAHLFDQGHHANNEFAYITPKWHGLQFKTAVLTPKVTNDQNVDIFVLRALYNQGNFNLVFNRVAVDESYRGSDITEQLTRYAVASNYQLNNLYIAGLVEHIDDELNGDNRTIALSAQYELNDITLKVGSQIRRDLDGIEKDESLYLASASYNLDKHVALFVETAQYQKDSKHDTISLGVKYKF